MKDPRTFKKPYVHSAYSHLVHRHSQICTPSHTHTQTHTHSHSTKTSFWYAVLFWFQTTCRYIESSPEQQGCFQQLIFTLSVDCSAMVTVPSQSELWSFFNFFLYSWIKRPIRNEQTRCLDPLIYSIFNFTEVCVLKFYASGSGRARCFGLLWYLNPVSLSLSLSLSLRAQPTCWTPCCWRTDGRGGQSGGPRRAAARPRSRPRTCSGVTATTTAPRTPSTIRACTVKHTQSYAHTRENNPSVSCV